VPRLVLRKAVRARLMHRRVRVLGGPAVRAAFGGDLSLPWLPPSVVSRERRAYAISRLVAGRLAGQVAAGCVR
jgi:hypothetical protein